MTFRNRSMLLAALVLIGACKEKDDSPMALQCPNPAADHKPRHPLPDAFTPNGDGKNDFLFPFMDTTITAVEQSVYNRDGKKIAHSTAITGWNGRDESGNPAPAAPYLVKYRIEHRNAPAASGELWVTIFGPAAGRNCVLAPPDCDPNSYTFPDQYDLQGTWYSTGEAICIK